MATGGVPGETTNSTGNELQPFKLTVKKYDPSPPFISGFWSLDIKPFGPVQEYVSPIPLRFEFPNNSIVVDVQGEPPVAG